MKNIFQKFMALLLMVVISIVLAQIEMGSGIALAFALPVGFANLTYPCGEENMGGYMNRILFIPACSVSAVPELSTTEATTAADLRRSLSHTQADDTCLPEHNHKHHENNI